MSAPFAVDPDAARRAAREILSGHEYRPDTTPRPLDGVLRWIGDRLDEIFGPIGRFFEAVFDPLFHLLPGWLGTVLGVVLTVGIASFVIWLVLRSRLRSAATVRPRAAANAGPAEDPDDLERAAAAADRDGDYHRAIRLRYRAGLLRLARSGAIALRPGTTNATVARALHSRRFDALTDTFENVAYGDRPATVDDATAAAAEWPAVLTESGAR
ncbi:MAG: DUF4129 domain-containing protein [Acidimicrobiia bacterium]